MPPKIVFVPSLVLIRNVNAKSKDVGLHDADCQPSMRALRNGSRRIFRRMQAALANGQHSILIQRRSSFRQVVIGECFPNRSAWFASVFGDCAEVRALVFQAFGNRRNSFAAASPYVPSRNSHFLIVDFILLKCVLTGSIYWI